MIPVCTCIVSYVIGGVVSSTEYVVMRPLAPRTDAATYLWSSSHKHISQHTPSGGFSIMCTPT